MTAPITTACPRCGGSGHLHVDEPECNGGVTATACERCGGTGRVGKTAGAQVMGWPGSATEEAYNQGFKDGVEHAAKEAAEKERQWRAGVIANWRATENG